MVVGLGKQAKKNDDSNQMTMEAVMRAASQADGESWRRQHEVYTKYTEKGQLVYCCIKLAAQWQEAKADKMHKEADQHRRKEARGRMEDTKE